MNLSKWERIEGYRLGKEWVDLSEEGKRTTTQIQPRRSIEN